MIRACGWLFAALVVASLVALGLQATAYSEGPSNPGWLSVAIYALPVAALVVGLLALALSLRARRRHRSPSAS